MHICYTKIFIDNQVIILINLIQQILINLYFVKGSF
jgi:hypothetical protein